MSESRDEMWDVKWQITIIIFFRGSENRRIERICVRKMSECRTIIKDKCVEEGWCSEGEERVR